MCGFPWLLEQREQVRSNRLLAPNMYVAGHILNYFPMGIYATEVTSVAAARQAVAAQQQAGYDFIKVHNVLPEPIYEAIAAAARQAGMQVVGHIPHDISIARAVALGQRTFEHFKGYYLDATLTLTSEDYREATAGALVWNCPTFYTRRVGLGTAELAALRTREEMRYVSRREFEQWLRDSTEEGAEARHTIFELSKKIFGELLRLPARFVAGTDSGSYSNTVPGFALIEELETMAELGMSNDEVLRAATVNAAEAMDRTAEFGTVAVGKRADLLLLERDPRVSIANVRRPLGVMVRGIWLDRPKLDSMLERIEAIHRKLDGNAGLDSPSHEAIAGLMDSMSALAEVGWVFKHHQLDALASSLRERGLDQAADRVLGWKEPGDRPKATRKKPL
jgi:hypothetical protein